MTDNTYNQNLQDGKPVNINISFNISRKQVTQNLNPFEQQRSFKIKSDFLQDNPTTNVKSKNPSFKPPKTPQLSNTDRNVYSKELEYERPTEQLKRKNKRKKSTGQFPADKTTSFAFYQYNLQKSGGGHKRGLTTGVIKKPIFTANKPKKSKDESIRNSSQSQQMEYSKSESKGGSMQKSLKNMIHKIINNQLSKRSLPLPHVNNKSKYNQSTSLTTRKGPSSSRPTKKRSSKTIIKQKPSQEYQPKQQPKDKVQQRFVNKNQLLMKLSNLKSVQNSMLINQVDKMQQKQDLVDLNKQYKNKKCFVIKTDQSIECIDEIHNYQKNKFKQEFFGIDNDEDNDNQQLRKASETQFLIQNYIQLLNEQHEMQSDPLYFQKGRYVPNHEEDLNGEQYDEMMEDPERATYLKQEDFLKVNQLLKSVKSQKKSETSNLSPINNIEELEQQERVHNLSQNRDIQKQNNQMLKVQIQSKEKNTEIVAKQPISSKRQTQLIQEKERTQKNKQKCQITRTEEEFLKVQQGQQDGFKPFISSQMGRQASYVPRQLASVSPQQRVRLNEIKRNQIEKWGYLLEYIKQNINKESNTQQVLEQVYTYLQQAKIDLLQQQQQNNSQAIYSKSPLMGNLLSNSKQERLEEQFTNKLSSQFSKQPNSSDELSHNRNNTRFQNQMGNQDNRPAQGQYKNSQQSQQQLDQQIKSFKSEYQQNQDIKYMNLQTIQSALKNRFNTLNEKKQKQISKLELLFDENKIAQIQFNQQKLNLEKWFKHQTNQILLVKKNIWKGYNEAKSILDKSYINSTFQQQYRSQLNKNRKKSASNDKQRETKGRKMMKCLSESYLTKKKVDYKKFIEDQQRKREEEEHNMENKRVLNAQGSESSQLSQQEEQQDQESSYIEHNNDYKLNKLHDEDEEEDEYENSESNDFGSERKAYEEDSSSNVQSSQVKNNTLSEKYSEEFYKDSSEEKYKDEDAINQLQTDKKTLLKKQNEKLKEINEGEMNELNKKLSKLKEEQLSSLGLEEDQDKNNYLSVKVSKNKPLEKEQRKDSYEIQSPSYSNNPLSPTSIHYEELQKDLHSQSEENPSDLSQDYVNEDEDKYEYEEQQQNIISEQFKKSIINKPSQTSNKVKPAPHQQQQVFDIQKQREHSKKNKKLSKLSKQPQQQYDYQPQQHEVKHQIIHTNNYQQQQLIKKFKYLTEEDKEDIFQFLFLDLCIELYQQPCPNNRIWNMISAYITKMHQMHKRKKGVKTNLNVVKDYLKRFCGYILRTNKKTLDNLNVPMGPTAIQMLKYMHENDDLEEQIMEESENVVTLIIPVSIFDTFERSLLPTLQFQKYYDDEEKEQQRVNFLKNILHIHNKALYDALNEFLDQQRLFGMWGKPFPWIKTSSFSHVFNQTELEQKLKKSAEKVVEACSYVCGLLVDKEQSLVGNAKISEGYIEQIRQDRISRMLANEMIENEERWVFYDDEQTQVLVETANHVYNRILKEAMEELLVLKKRELEVV